MKKVTLSEKDYMILQQAFYIVKHLPCTCEIEDTILSENPVYDECKNCVAADRVIELEKKIIEQYWGLRLWG